MKNRIQVFSAFTLMLIGTISYGQTIDTKSKAIMDNITKSYKSKKNTYFKFIYTNSGSSQTGIFYSDNNRYKLKIMGIEQIFDGNKVYSINDEDKEITVSKPNDSQVAFSPLSYIDSYKKDYNVHYAGKTKLSGIPVDILKMSPTKANGIKNVILYVNVPQKKLIKLEQISSNNDTSVISISNYKENQQLPSTVFSVDKSKYQNYLVTEL